MGEESKWAVNVSEKHQPAHERVRELGVWVEHEVRSSAISSSQPPLDLDESPAL